ncbi:DUF192 domain-containing protein [Azoarcus olearius]|uniref:Conserved hypothetical secreted protein n=1 Tax=Azoarcus sp. (strain BH72) TaxID=418699 RepID=A1K4G4_AZOSB|nr:DUF192 domain-containing protein [Azoarcus olearius]ANQ84267.1 hypothetical protein dqs_1213 [Azoarcus olearius]CAL93719.1 conserved hypothetical secreted protein [Azoarcus olearius]
MSVRAVLLRAVFALALGAASAAHARAEMPLAELSAGMYRIPVEVAATPQSRQLGLMNRKEMPQQQGMVFVFTEDARHCMWMKNTLLPLSVAFLDGQGRILNIEDMQPQTEDSHCARGPARFALEMNQGWFRERGLRAGDQIRGVERLPAGY